MLRMPLTLRRLDPKTGLPMPAEPVWGSDLERGLFIQKYPGPLGVWYGVTHHSGLAVSGPGYTYAASRGLQRSLLQLTIDWTATGKQLQTWQASTEPETRLKFMLARAMLTIWEHTYAAWNADNETLAQRVRVLRRRS